MRAKKWYLARPQTIARPVWKKAGERNLFIHLVRLDSVFPFKMLKNGTDGVQCVVARPAQRRKSKTVIQMQFSVTGGLK